MSNRWLLCALSLAGLADLVHAAPLSFTAALDLAERQSPSLAANAAQIRAAQAAAIPAGALPDPKLFVGIDNYPVSGMDRWRLESDSMTMQKIGVMQEFPNAAKRRAREEIAVANAGMAEAQQQVARLKLRRDTAQAWLRRYYLERQTMLFDELEHENRVLAEAVRAQIAGGRAQAADAVLPRQEAAQLADRRDDLARDMAKAHASLRRVVGDEGDQALAGAAPVFPVDAEPLHRHLHQHPELQAFVAETRKADAEVREAAALKKPDWGVELAYQRRAPEFGDMISIQFTLDLPVSPATRQDPLIAAKQHELARIDAEREAMLREHGNELDNSLAEYAALSRQADRAKYNALPLAQEKVKLQTASYQAGKGDLAAVLAARRELIDQRLKVIDLEGQRATVAAQLHFAYGEIEQ